MKMANFCAKLSKHKYKIALTTFLFLNNFSYGITLNILGASLVDLAYVYGVSLNGISILPIASGVGYLGGSLSSYLYRFMSRQLLVNISVLMMAVTIGLLPHYGSVPVAFIALLFQGFGSGALDVALNVLLVEWWPSNNGPLLQAAQFMYGAGAIAGPLMVAPYLMGEPEMNDPDISNQTISSTTNSTSPSIEQRIHSLTLPFLVCGLLQSIVPLIWMSIQWINKSNTKSNLGAVTVESCLEKDSGRKMSSQVSETKSEGVVEGKFKLDPKAATEAAVPNRRCKLTLCGLALATIISAELAHFNFSSALLQNLPNLVVSASTAATVMSLLSVALTIGRLVTTVVAVWLSPDLIIGYHYALIALGIVGFYLGQSELWSILLATVLLGYGYCAQWSAWFSFTDRWLRLTESVCSFYSFVLGVVSLAVPLVLAQTFEGHPMVVLVLEVVLLALSMACFATVKLWIAWDNRRVISTQ